jgi:hypothetical protein
MRLSLTLLKEKVQIVTGLISFTLKEIKCPKNQRHQNKFVEHRSTRGIIQTQTQTFPGRNTIVRSEDTKNYTLINYHKLGVRKADYLGQAILKTQSKVVME